MQPLCGLDMEESGTVKQELGGREYKAEAEASAVQKRCAPLGGKAGAWLRGIGGGRSPLLVRVPSGTALGLMREG